MRAALLTIELWVLRVRIALKRVAVAFAWRELSDATVVFGLLAAITVAGIITWLR